MRSMSSRSPIGSFKNMRRSIRRGSRRRMGLNSIRARISRSMSMPGAISISSSPSWVSLSKPEKGRVKTAAIVKVELIRLINHGLGVRCCAEVEAACRHAAYNARLRRQCQQVDDFFLVGNVGDAFGHADTQINDAVGI